MGDLSAHREKASKIIQAAKQCEEEEKWTDAFDNYMKALEIFNHMCKCKYWVSASVLPQTCLMKKY